MTLRESGVRATSAPGAPTNLSVSAVAGVVTMTWNPPESGDAPSGYIVEAGSERSLANLANFPTGNISTTFSRSGVAAGRYFVRIRAVNAVGAGPPSNEAILLVDMGPCSPPGTSSLTLTTNRGGRVKSWILKTHKDQLARPDTLWVAYPKGNRADINRDSVWPILGEYGMRPIGQASVDDVWSAMRFRPNRKGEAPFTGGR